MTLQIHAIPVLSDNYAWLLHDTGTNTTAVVDPGDANAMEQAIEAQGGRLDLILLTHHHHDHTGGTQTLRERYRARVVGPASERDRMPPLDMALEDGDTIAIGDSMARVIATPGHTRGHICYYFSDPPALFCGDTLFSLGCGRLFEGTAAQLFASLRRFDDLPPETLVCCGHEYTLGNAAFARHVDPDNAALRARSDAVRRLRQTGQPTVPSTLAQERATNPFLRAADAQTLGRLRAEKDNF
ncbi:MAG: hydroxyacylglutathione hydrolase [Acetobacter sp.]|uniref:hydroxyacylglutathione hydrolase n=1 Tax=Acetobacter sp. TaxID=440 RepID=UPI0039E74324